VKTTLEIVNRMQAAGIVGKYAIGGAVGATFYLEPSATLDVDIFVVLPTTAGSSLTSLAPIYEYLKTQGCQEQGEHILIEDWPVQFLPANNPLEKEALEQAVTADVEGTSTFVLSAEHLIAIALRTGRAKDYNGILQFLEQSSLNETKLKAILGRHQLESKWDEFRRKYMADK
jgi:hypothetical protein